MLRSPTKTCSALLPGARPVTRPRSRLSVPILVNAEVTSRASALIAIEDKSTPSERLTSANTAPPVTMSGRVERVESVALSGGVSLPPHAASAAASAEAHIHRGPRGIKPAIFIWSPEVSRSARVRRASKRSEEHTSELQSRLHLVCRLLLEKKKKKKK